MNFRTKSGLVLCLICFLTAIAAASPVERENKTINRQDESKLEVSMDFGAGTIELARGDADKILDAHFEYEPKYVDLFVDYDTRGTTGILELSGDFFRDSYYDKDITNDWRVKLTDALPMTVAMDMGAAEADIDFTGLQITDLDMDIGAADARLWWDKPNPVSMREMKIDCGASSFKMSGIGNANFEYLDFEGGVGSFDLDFTGDWQQSAEADFDVGLGSLEIILPSDIGVRIVTDDSFLSSVDVDRRYREVDDDEYESGNYADAKIRLTIRISIGMGSVDIRSTRR